MVRRCRATVVCAIACISPCFAQPVDHKASAKRAWADREARLRECMFEWAQEYSIPKGGLADSIGLTAPDGARLPRQDMRYTERLKLTLKGDEFRLEYDGNNFRPSTESLDPVKYTAVYDGVNGIEYRDQPGAPVNTGTRTLSGGASTLRRTDTLPLLWACRLGGSAYQSIDLDRFEATGRSATVNGRGCVELVAIFQGGQVTWSVWVDPTADYLVVRSLNTNTTTGATYRSPRYDIEYAPSASGELLPSRWTIINQGKGLPVSRKIVAVASKAAVGVAASKETFDTSAPAGSVIDERNGDEYRRLVVHPDGTKREAEPGESNQVYLEAAGMAPPPRPVRGRVRTFLLAGALILTIGAGFLLWKRLRAPAPPPGTA